MSAAQEFAARVPDFVALAKRPAQLVPYFAHYLEEESPGFAVTPKSLVLIFEELRVRPPANLSDVLRKSNRFVSVRGGGYRLSHEGQRNVAAALLPRQSPASVRSTEPASTEQPAGENVGVQHATRGKHFSERNVLVIYGRDHRLRQDLFSLLRAVGLNPLEFEEMAHQTGSTSPYTLEVLQTAFKNVQACVALLSPDEHATLRADLRRAEDHERPELQPRGNVLIETGMAIALQPQRTILVRVGKVRSFSDFDGIQYVNLTGSAESRNKLVGRLRLAGCDVKSHGEDWLTVGNFDVKVEG